MKTWKKWAPAIMLVFIVFLLTGTLWKFLNLERQEDLQPPLGWINIGSEYVVHDAVVLCDDFGGFIYFKQSSTGVMFPPGKFVINIANKSIAELYCAEWNIWIPAEQIAPDSLLPKHPGQDYLTPEPQPHPRSPLLIPTHPPPPPDRDDVDI